MASKDYVVVLPKETPWFSLGNTVLSVLQDLGFEIIT